MSLNLNLGILLLYLQEGRVTSFTREWAERAIHRFADYVFAQSGGRETISFKVFDWIKLPLTSAQWHELGMNAYNSNSVQMTLKEHLKGETLGPYTHILIVIDDSNSSGGTTPGTVTHLAATDFTPSFVAHELGHVYGADDAFRETAEGPVRSHVRYENRFCVMGRKGWPATFADEVLADENASMLNQNGPGMCVPTLLTMRWLKEDEHGLGLDLSGSTLSSGGKIEELSALAGSPGPGWMHPPLFIRYHDLLVEYRVGDGWDRGLLNPGAGGWVVVHRSPRESPSAIYIDSLAVRPGSMLVLGKDDPLNIFNLGPLRISVMSFNAAARTVRLHLSRRAPRPMLSSATYGAVDVGGGGLLYSPGKGFTPVPPHSPLLNVLEQVARLHALQEMLAIASANEGPGLTAEASHALRTLQASVAELRVEPSISPLEYVLESISKLHDTSERLTSSLTEDRETTREFVETSRQQLAEVKRIIAKTVADNRQQ